MLVQANAPAALERPGADTGIEVPMPEKFCSIEGCEKPRHCKGYCRMHYTRLWRHGDPLACKVFRVGEQTEKRCAACQITKPVDEFYLKANGGPRSHCKECYSERAKRRYLDGGKERNAQWREANREKAAECSRRYYAENPEKCHAATRRRDKRLLANGPVEHFLDREIFERDEWTCGICSGSVDQSLAWPDGGSASLDHVNPISLGGTHTRDNVRLAHLGCNIRRGNRVV